MTKDATSRFVRGSIYLKDEEGDPKKDPEGKSRGTVTAQTSNARAALVV